jgi:uncharacterized membrane protein
MLVPDQIHFALVFLALLGSGLIAGVFFSFSAFVMKALVWLPPAEGIATMQSINITVLNRWFLSVFLGTAMVCVLLLLWPLFLWVQKSPVYLIAGSAFYLVGSLMVTGIFNVPKNEALAKVDASAVDSEQLWRSYIDKWTNWNHVRTVASLLAMVCFGLGLTSV